MLCQKATIFNRLDPLLSQKATIFKKRSAGWGISQSPNCSPLSALREPATPCGGRPPRLAASASSTGTGGWPRYAPSRNPVRPKDGAQAAVHLAATGASASHQEVTSIERRNVLALIKTPITACVMLIKVSMTNSVLLKMPRYLTPAAPRAKSST
jgi:hypothetical protein